MIVAYFLTEVGPLLRKFYFFENASFSLFQKLCLLFRKAKNLVNSGFFQITLLHFL